MISFLLDLDQTVFLFLNGIHSRFWDEAMFLFSGKYIWVPMYLIFFFATFRAFKPKIAIVWVIAIVASIALSDQVCATFIRPYFERLRPSNVLNPISEFVHIVKDYRGGSYGFPSCHAANSFALATILGCVWRGSRLRWFIFIWAFLNSYSRIYLGVHYPGDLLVGGLIGCLIAFFVFVCSRAIVWKLCKGEMWESRPERLSVNINDHTISYTPIDWGIVVGIITTVFILLFSIG